MEYSAEASERDKEKEAGARRRFLEDACAKMELSNTK